MSLSKVRAALETHLLALSPSVATVPENGAYTPATGTPYQAMFLLPARPAETVGAGYRRELGVFQVSLMYPQNAGPGTAQARAEAVQAHFARGTVLSSGGVNVVIERTPYIRPGRKDGDRWRIDIDTDYRADVFS